MSVGWISRFVLVTLLACLVIPTSSAAGQTAKSAPKRQQATEDTAGQRAADQQRFQQALQDFRNNPSDAAREQVIKAALALPSKPPLPDEVLEIVGRGAYAIKNASSDADFVAAADAYAKASQLAPWVPNYYFNEGVAYEKAKRYDDAIAAYRWYLVAAPSASDADQVHEHIGGLKYAKEKMAQEQRAAEEERARQAEAETRKAREEQARKTANRLEGEWCQSAENDYDTCLPYTTYPRIIGRMRPVISRSGGNYSVKFIDLAGQGDVTCTDVVVNGSNIRFTYTWGGSVRYDLTMTDDGKQLHGTSKYYSNGQWMNACPGSTPCAHYVRVR